MFKGRTRRLLLCTSLLFASHVCADETDEFIQSEMQRQNIPGMSFAIVRGSEAVRIQSYGFANLEHRVPVTPHTVFQSGSIGKMFTAAAVLLLVTDGKLSLDESVRTYLPEAPASWQAVTLRQMINHTSGMGHDLKMDRWAEYSDEQLLKAAYVAAASLEFVPGTKFSYGNTAPITLGLLVRRVSGRHFGELLAERLFAPLGMGTARIVSRDAIIPNRAAGYRVRAGALRNATVYSETVGSTGAGWIYLSAQDYVKWAQAISRRALFSARIWQEVFRPAALNGGGSYPYGLGWDLDTTSGGKKVFSHRGQSPGFTAFIRRYDTDDVTFAVMTNAEHADPEYLLQGIVDRYDSRLDGRGAPAPDPKSKVSTQVRAVWDKLRSGTLSAADLPGLPADEFPQFLQSFPVPLIREAGECGALLWSKDVRNGDVLERHYDVDCANRRLRVWVELDRDDEVSGFDLYGLPQLPRDSGN